MSPIDASIPLSGRPQPSAVQQLQQVMGLRGAMQEQQAGSLELEQKKRAMQAQQALDEIAQQTLNADGSVNVPAIKDALTRRGFYHLVPAIEKNLMEAQDARAKLDKTIAETGETSLKSQQLKLEILGAHAASLQALHYDPAAFVSTLGLLQGQGVIPKDEAANAMVMGIERPELIQQWTEKTLAASKQQRELATSASTAASSAIRANATQAEADARLPGLQAEGAIKQRQLAGMSPEGLSADQQADNARQATAAADLAAYRAARLKQGPAGNAAAAQDTSNVKEAVLGMKDGTVPPIMPSRASREYVELMAESHRQGFDLVRANEDWAATQKYLSTLNGTQQVKLRQAINFTKESIPTVRDLVTQWDAGHFPILNSINLKAAKNGIYGEQAASIASRLQAQIADLTSELGTVYKGGNSSTDESLKLAAENLKADWSKKVALDALDQIDRNITIRQHSMKNAGIVANEGNPYTPKQATEPVATPPSGNGLTYQDYLKSRKKP